MASYTHKRIDDMQGGAGGSFKKARAELGVSSFGMQVIDLPANETRHPEHDHTGDGQEEVYVPLSGWTNVEVDGEPIRVEVGEMLRVAPAARRAIRPGDADVRVLVLGGTPGAAFESHRFTELKTEGA